MNSLPQSFLVVNHEGVHRCYIQLEQVADFGHLVAKFAQHKLLLVHKLAPHPLGMIHLALNSRDSQPIIILEAFKGTLGLQTSYHLVKKGEKSWISPRYYSGSGSKEGFELRCEFNFEVWASSGLHMFFALNFNERSAQAWTNWKGQNYRVPFGNVFDTGAICMGDLDNIMREPPLVGLNKMMEHLSASIWNSDAFDQRSIEPVSELVRFDSETLAMLPPLHPEKIAHLGVMAHPQIAEISRLIYG